MIIQDTGGTQVYHRITELRNTNSCPNNIKQPSLQRSTKCHYLHYPTHVVQITALSFQESRESPLHRQWKKSCDYHPPSNDSHP